MATYNIGDVVYLSWTAYNSSGVAANPGTVTLSITLPDGSTTTSTTSTTATGVYTASYTPTKVGRHVYSWAATGTWPQAYNDVFEVRDITDIGVVGLDEVKAHLNIPTTVLTDDSELLRVIDAATDLAQNYCGIILGRKTYAETYNGGGGGYIVLRHPNAISITSVVEDSVTLTSGTDYYLDLSGQRLVRIGTSGLYWTNTTGNWSPGIQNVVVTYVAGYANPPASVRQGVLEIIRHLWQTQRGAMIALGQGTADEFYPASTYSLPRRAMELLDPASLPSIY